MKEIEILDPTAGETAPSWPLAPSVDASLALRFGLLDISKPQGDVFLDTLQQWLEARGHAVLRYRKTTMARPADDALVTRIAGACDAVVVALAD